MSKLRVGFRNTGTKSPCERTEPVNGFTRLACGLLYYASGAPPRFAITKQLPDTTIEIGPTGGVLTIITNNVPNGKNYSSGSVTRHGDGRISLPIPPRASGYLQCNIGNEHDDIDPCIGFQSTVDATAVQCERKAIAGFFTFGGSGIAGGGQPCGPSPGGALVAIELMPNKTLRGWSDPGSDPRFAYQAGPSTIVLPFYFSLYAYNDQNGFKGTASFNHVIACTARAIAFVNGPPNGSVRISVNGVVQVFAGPVNYMNLSAAGAGSYDPAAGVWFPSVIRYEIFSGAALGGVLVADLTIQKAWGGDTIGAP